MSSPSSAAHRPRKLNTVADKDASIKVFEFGIKRFIKTIRSNPGTMCINA